MSARVLLAASALVITASGCGGDPAAPSPPAARPPAAPGLPAASGTWIDSERI